MASEPQFKVGDRVRVRPGNWCSGIVGTVVRVEDRRTYRVYIVRPDAEQPVTAAELRFIESQLEPA